MRLTLLLVLVCAFVFAQSQSTSGGQTSSSSGTTTPPSHSTRQPSWGNATPVAVTGKVVLDSGIAPPDSARVELRCGSTNFLVGFTDSSGGFGSPSSGSASTQDASISDPSAAGPGGLGAISLPVASSSRGASESCELWATYPGYSSGPVRLPNNPSPLLGRRNLGTVILHRLANVPGNTVSASAVAAPKAADKALRKGQEAMRKQKWSEAIAQFHKATEIYPQHAIAWYELGRIFEQQHDLVAGRDALRRAISIDARYVAPYLTLAHLACTDQKWPEALEASEHAIQLDPVDFPEAFFFNAVANLNLGRAPAAEKSLRAGIQIDSAHRFPRLHQLLGILLAQRREFTAAAESLRAYLKIAPGAPDAETVNKQVSELDRLASAGRGPARQ